MAITTKHQLLAWDLVEGLGDPAHKGIYFRLAKTYDESFLREILSNVKNYYSQGKIKSEDRGRYFMGILKKEAVRLNLYPKKKMVKILKIIQEGDPVLRKKAEPVKNPKTPEIKELVADMIATMEKANGIGLAAPQVGLSYQIFTIKLEDKVYVFINPEIKDLSSEIIPFEEGCLSVKKMWGPVIRPKKLTIKAIDENGKPIKIRAKGLLARVIQHEIDHLNGRLFIDKAEKLYSVESESSTEL